MKILLVGGSSTLAQVLKPYLVPFAEVVTAGRSGCNVELDLAWPVERFEIPDGVDVVVNLAAHFGGEHFSDWIAAEEINVLGALKLAQAASRSGVKRLVQVSTIFTNLPADSAFFNWYALSKRHAEDVLQLHCRQVGLPLTIVCPAQIYGEGEIFRRHQPFLYALLDKAERAENIVLNGSNDALRNFIHVDDVAEIIARMIRLDIGGRHVCASLRNVRFSEIAAIAIEVMGSASKISFDANKPNIPSNAFDAEEDIYQLIGYFPRITLREGLTREAKRRKATLP